uniref:Clade I nitrous oxide reductase n=1 Tax=Heligmosomoides polygyrus TaxID=6339 RepID=A0A183GX94_HELPZ
LEEAKSPSPAQVLVLHRRRRTRSRSADAKRFLRSAGRHALARPMFSRRSPNAIRTDGAISEQLPQSHRRHETLV